jgi:hypothetical protein
MMIHRSLAAFSLMIVATWAGTAWAQSVGSLPWLSAKASAIQSGGASAQQAARAELIRVGEKTFATPTYPPSLAAALMPVVTSGNTRAKLNAAIVLERAAARTASPSLLPAVTALLDDRCDAVALWGVKAARPLIAAGGATSSWLAPQVVATVKAHPSSGPIAEEAYAALLCDPLQPMLVDSILATLQMRISAYGTGVPPPSPFAEHQIPAYLIATCWPQATPAGRMRILTALGKFTCATAGAVADGSSDGAIVEMARLNAEGLEAIGNRLPSDALVTAAKSLSTLEPSRAATIPTDCKALTAALADLGVVLEPRRALRPGTD